MLGKWLDLGYQNWYSTSKPINSLADVQGMKIRSPGGAGISWRIHFWGGIPNTTAWPNVPLALSQGTFDGFVTTDESVASAKLWEAGVKHSYADHQFVGEYIPMVSQIFWRKLSPDLQTRWSICGNRTSAPIAPACSSARSMRARRCRAAASPWWIRRKAEIADARKKMMAAQASLIKDSKLSPEIVKLATADIGSAA